MTGGQWADLVDRMLDALITGAFILSIVFTVLLMLLTVLVVIGALLS